MVLGKNYDVKILDNHYQNLILIYPKILWKSEEEDGSYNSVMAADRYPVRPLFVNV